jgi:hypothetical protein
VLDCRDGREGGSEVLGGHPELVYALQLKVCCRKFYW